MAESITAPTLEEARSWVGWKLDEMGGAAAGRVEGLLVDAEDESPTWILARLGRFGRRVAVPVEFVAAGVGHIWIPFDRDALRAASEIDPAGGLTAGAERALAERYGAEPGERLNGREDDQPGSVPASG